MNILFLFSPFVHILCREFTNKSVNSAESTWISGARKPNRPMSIRNRTMSIRRSTGICIRGWIPDRRDDLVPFAVFYSMFCTFITTKLPLYFQIVITSTWISAVMLMWWQFGSNIHHYFIFNTFSWFVGHIFAGLHAYLRNFAQLYIRYFLILFN